MSFHAISAHYTLFTLDKNKGGVQMVKIFMVNALIMLKQKVKPYVKIYCKGESIHVEIIDYKMGNTFTYMIQDIYYLLNRGYTSQQFALDVLKEYQRYVLNLFFN